MTLFVGCLAVGYVIGWVSAAVFYFFYDRIH
jgi:uncharacterized membrane protein YciS (DUF1049 family)